MRTSASPTENASRNTTSVTTTLGGGEHGHQGLIMPDHVYAKTTGTKYERPKAPKPLATTSTDPLIIQKEKDKHQDDLDEFTFVNALERTITAQIQAAYSPKVLLPKIDRKTGLLKVTLSDLFQYLLKTYGNITAPALAAEKQAVLHHVYAHDEPLDIVFERILAYGDKADTFGCPETDEQLMHMATIILMNANIFADALQEWNGKDASYKTWDTFQDFFINYQAKYKEARSTATTASEGFTPVPQANVVSSAPLPPSFDHHALAVQEAEAYQAYANEVAQFQPAPAQVPQANVAASPSADLIQQLVEQMKTLTTKVETVEAKSGGQSNNKGKNKSKKNDSKERLYCWTHFACAHTGKDCNNKNEGHKDDATFTNMMGGSKKNCYWLNNAAPA